MNDQEYCCHNDDDNDNDDLFFKIIRNIYLKNLIFHHVRLFNNNYHVQAFTMESLSKYEYKEYLRWILIKDYKEQDEKLMCKLLNSLPNIQVLESEKEYNQALPNISISQTSIKTIKFGEKFDQPLLMYTLPMKNVQQSLTSLTMGNSFNQSVDTFIQLVNLKTLVFGNFFNQPINVGHLPPSITLLQFGHAYNQKMSYGSLPINLEILKLGPLYNKTLFPKKPKKTKNSVLFKLIFDNKKKTNNKKIEFNIKLEKESITPLSKLRILELGELFNGKLKQLGTLPYSLETIKFGGIFNQKLRIPNISKYTSLTTLRFGRLFNQKIDILPPFLKNLIFSFHFNNVIKIPQSHQLENIEFGYMYNQPIDFLKFTNLKSLTFGHCFQKNFIGTISTIIPKNANPLSSEFTTTHCLLPDSLTYLNISECTRFNQPFDKKNCLPPNLKSLFLFKKYKSAISLDYLPKGLIDFELNITDTNIHLLELNLPISKIILKSNLPNYYKPVSSSSSLSSSSSSSSSSLSLSSPCNISSSLTSSSSSSSSSLSLSSSSSSSSSPPYNIKSSINIKSIQFDYFYNTVFKLFKIPNSIETLIFNQFIDSSLLKLTNLPMNLKSLHITYIGNKELILDSNLLPPTIISLYINNSNSIPVKIKSLPKSLKEIYCKNSNLKFINYCLNNNYYQILKIIE